MDQKGKSFGGNHKGRIILLGDGTGVLTDSDDTEMFDHDHSGDEDKDLASQVHKGTHTGHDSSESAASTDALPDTIDPKYKAAAEKFLSNSSESDKKSEDVSEK